MLIRMMRKVKNTFFYISAAEKGIFYTCIVWGYTFTQPESPFGDYKTYKTGHFAASQFDYDNKFFSTMVARKVPLLLFLYSSSSVGGWCLCLKAFSHRYRHHHFFSSSQLFEKKINRESNVLANAVNVALIGNMKIQNTKYKCPKEKYKIPKDE